MQSSIKNYLLLTLLISLPILAMEQISIDQKIEKVSKELSDLDKDHQESKIRQDKIENELIGIMKELDKDSLTQPEGTKPCQKSCCKNHHHENAIKAFLKKMISKK